MIVYFKRLGYYLKDKIQRVLIKIKERLGQLLMILNLRLITINKEILRDSDLTFYDTNCRILYGMLKRDIFNLTIKGQFICITY